MGDYVPEIEVDVNDMQPHYLSTDDPGYVGGTNIILEQYNGVSLIVQEQQERVNEYLDLIEDLIEDLKMPTNWTSALGNVVINPVPEIDITGIPEPGEIVLPGFSGIVFSPVPTLTTPPTINTDYLDPTVPTPVNPSLDYIMQTYTSEMWADLFAKVQDGVVNGGTGIDADVEDAIQARNLERQRVANETAYNLGVSEISSRALSFPQYAMQALANQVSAEVLKQSHNSSNEIAIASFDLAQKNTHFMVDKAVNLETILRDFWKVQETLSLQAKTAIADLVLRNYAEKIKAYIAEWQGITTSLQAKVETVNAIVAQNNAVIAGYKAETDGKIAQVDAIAKERDSLIKAGGLEVDVYKARVDGQSAWYVALAENQKAQLQKAELQLRQVESELKAELDSFVSINSLKEKIMLGAGGVSAQVMASALNAMNINVGATVTSSKSITENYGHNESKTISHGQSLSDSHNTNHTE
jgi:hypothetical protein